MEMKFISEKEVITRDDLRPLAEALFGTFVKAVVDIERREMVIGGELHADEETILLEHGSKQANLWGINLYPDTTNEDWIEFDSMINLRPTQGNRSRGVEDEALRKKIRAVVSLLVGDA